MTSKRKSRLHLFPIKLALFKLPFVIYDTTNLFDLIMRIPEYDSRMESIQISFNRDKIS